MASYLLKENLMNATLPCLLLLMVAICVVPPGFAAEPAAALTAQVKM